jgi:hypothetical protein
MVAKRQGKDPEALKVPPPPPELHYILPLFHRLSARRPMEQGVALPVPFSEIEARMRLERRHLKAWELDALEILDAAYLQSVHKPSGGA